jgi:hypothetical protein
LSVAGLGAVVANLTEDAADFATGTADLLAGAPGLATCTAGFWATITIENNKKQD